MKRSPVSPPAAAPVEVTTTIAFRLDARSAQALAERAAHLQTSPHCVARDMVMSLLREPDHRAAIRESLLVLHDSMGILRNDLATVAKALLTSAGTIKEHQAQAWIEHIFK